MEHKSLPSGHVSRECTLCLMRQSQAGLFLQTLKKPDLQILEKQNFASLHLEIQGEECKVSAAIDAIDRKFPGFLMEDASLEEGIHREMISRKKKLAFAESCTGGAIAARIVALPGASIFFLGSIVAYADQWKEHFLHVRRDVIQAKTAVSREVVEGMAKGLLEESDADYAVAVSGILGSLQDFKPPEPIGTVFIGIAERGSSVDIGKIHVSSDRKIGIETCLETALGALWRRVAHGALTFS